MHAMLLRFSLYIPVLILKNQRLKFSHTMDELGFYVPSTVFQSFRDEFSHTNNCSQINKFFVLCILFGLDLFNDL